MQVTNYQLDIDYDVPFYAAPPDGTHCVQASLRMILKYFWPRREFTIEDLDKISAKVPGLWTWGFARALWLQRHGFEVIELGNFDTEKFIREGAQYLLDAYGEEWASAQIRNSDIDQERGLASEYIKEINVKRVIPTLMDIQMLLAKGYLVICLVNWRTLHREAGYAGHSVVIKGFDTENVIMHDPGPPSQANCSIPFDLFEKAWAYPDATAKYLSAIKLRRDTNLYPSGPMQLAPSHPR